jgi:tetrapyrrole methylase family protein/MazG family protein
MSEQTLPTKQRSMFEELYSIVKRLRAPDGCPWDKKQTARSLKSFLLEEIYECFEAIDDNDTDHLKEELGDVFMLTTMITYIMEQKGTFSVEEVLEEVNTKLVRRHPHVFGDAKIATSEEVVRQWQTIKKDLEGRNETGSVLSKIPRNIPPLERAYQIQRRCSQVGFDWIRIGDVLTKIKEEFAELEDARLQSSGIEEEFGDLLFSMVNLSRYLKIDPTLALHRANNKFSRRFAYVEDEMRRRDIELKPENMETMDMLWMEAKKKRR